MKTNVQMKGNILGYPCIGKGLIAGQDDIIDLDSSTFKEGMGSWVEEYLNEEFERLRSNRATGRTARLVDDYVQKFFNEPMNTPIAIQDHYSDRSSDYQLLQKIVKRLDNEYPHIKYEKDNLKCTITRTSMTLRERAIKKINAIYQWKRVLEKRD